MRPAADMTLDRLVWADQTAAQKCEAVADQLVKGRSVAEAALQLSVIYGPIGANHVRGVADRHKLFADPAISAAQTKRRAEEQAAARARAHARAERTVKRVPPSRAGTRSGPSRLSGVPLPKLGNTRKRKNLTLFDLKAMSCRRPLWGRERLDPAEQFYCGKPALRPFGYCAACHGELHRLPGEDK